MIPTRWLALGMCAAAAVVLWPFLPWVVLAFWLGASARRIHIPLTRKLGDRPQLAAVIVMVGLTLLLVPVIALLASVVAQAVELVQTLRLPDGVRDSVPSDPVDVLTSHGERLWDIAQRVVGIATGLVVGLLILITGAYAFLVEGDRWYAWSERHLPLAPGTLRRLSDAFLETGHGLFVGIGGAGLIQSVFATAAYLYLGVPQPLALGFLTLLFSVVPAIGTAVVWVPVAVGLALGGRTAEAVGLIVFGVAVIGTVDNLARPYLARRGQLKLPTYVVLLAMFGGLAVIGAWGVVMGPLIVRLAAEALAIARDDVRTE